MILGFSIDANMLTVQAVARRVFGFGNAGRRNCDKCEKTII